MSEKIKYNKTELKMQKDFLKQRMEFLPVLELKKQQLQMVIDSLVPMISDRIGLLNSLIEKMSSWYQFFTEDIGFPLQELCKVTNVVKNSENIAGVEVPNFDRVEFSDKEYDLFLTPSWVDQAEENLREIVSLKEEIKILNKKKELVEEELRQTTIRVNLFEKVLIPQHKENIRKIKIYLGDIEVAAISIAKIAKSKSVHEEV